MATLETSPEANYDTTWTDKATYRGTSYRSAQKVVPELTMETKNPLHELAQETKKGLPEPTQETKIGLTELAQETK